MLDLAAKVNENEPGNHLYKLCKDSEGNYVVMEIYEDEAVLEATVSLITFESGAGFKGIFMNTRTYRMTVVG